MDVDTLGALTRATTIATLTSALMLRSRPDLRRSPLLRAFLGVSAVAFTVLALFWVSFIAVLSDTGDLRG
jgi:hypothetical protein